MQGAIYVQGSHNTKLSADGKVDCTYTSIQKTCPDTCELKDTGCYAQQSYVGMVNSRLTKEASGLSTLEIARAEASVIDSSYRGGKVPSNRHMRVHVSGDSKTIKGSRLINSAVGRWKKRGDGTNKVWSYTHAWRKIPAKIWSNVSMLASVDKSSDVKEAREQGYAPAIVVPEFKSDKAFAIEGTDTKWIPCPAQTKDKVTCASCKLCMRSEFLYQNNMGIAFSVHGSRSEKLKRRLEVIR